MREYAAALGTMHCTVESGGEESAKGLCGELD